MVSYFYLPLHENNRCLPIFCKDGLRCLLGHRFLITLCSCFGPFFVVMRGCGSLSSGLRLWKSHCTNICLLLFRVTNIRFSKCSGIGGLCLTQALEIRHPWLSSHSRQRPVAELLVTNRTLRKSNILHSHNCKHIFVQCDFFKF